MLRMSASLERTTVFTRKEDESEYKINPHIHTHKCL